MRHLILVLLADIFKSRATKKIEAAIVKQVELLSQVSSEKEKYRYKDPEKYSHYWLIEKDCQRNIDLLRGLL